MVITGAHFTGASSVKFGSTAASTFFVTSPTTIKAGTKPHAAGTVTVTVTTPGGTSGAGEHYTFDAVPTLSKITPSSGKTAGGTTVTLTGTGFVTGATVAFGTEAGRTVSVLSPETIKARAPAHPAGTVTVTVTTPGGTSGKETYTYDPVLDKVTPGAGKTVGGTVVTLTGAGFVHGATVAFGTAAGRTVTVVSPDEITVTSPPHTSGVVRVTVTTPSGTSAGIPYSYDAVPTLRKVTPSAGRPPAERS